WPLDPETGQASGERAHVAFACAAMRVVAEVDVELGLTRVVWIGTAQDVGRALNPQAVYGQIEGGTAQGLGLALMEEIQTRDGLITNASFTDYLVPTALDMPPVDAVLVEEEGPAASGSGPTVPCDPASFRVWHDVQPAVTKTPLPGAVLAVGVAGLASPPGRISTATSAMAAAAVRGIAQTFLPACRRLKKRRIQA